ncbi:MAG: MoaD family protein [Desulfurococcaceae archaeon]
MRVRYYLWLANKTKIKEEDVELPDDSTLDVLLKKISENKPEDARRIIQEIADGKSEFIILLNSKTPTNGLKTQLKDGDEVSLMPPVSGGSSALM